MRSNKLRTRYVPAKQKSSAYLDDIIRNYRANQQTLEGLAGGSPLLQPRYCSCDDLDENRLLDKQDTLLELAAQVEPDNLEQLHQLLSLWYIVAIKEVAAQDIPMADRLALAVYKFTEKATETG